MLGRSFGGFEPTGHSSRNALGKSDERGALDILWEGCVVGESALVGEGWCEGDSKCFGAAESEGDFEGVFKGGIF